jgi:hypothetical protein
MPSSESDSDNDREVLMVGQSDFPEDQTEQEIAEVAAAVIAR